MFSSLDVIYISKIPKSFNTVSFSWKKSFNRVFLVWRGLVAFESSTKFWYSTQTSPNSNTMQTLTYVWDIYILQQLFNIHAGCKKKQWIMIYFGWSCPKTFININVYWIKTFLGNTSKFYSVMIEWHLSHFVLWTTLGMKMP